MKTKREKVASPPSIDGGELIKKLILEVVIKAAIAGAIAAFPFLGLPFISPIVGAIFGYVGNLIADQLIKIAGDLKIDIQVEGENFEYKNAEKGIKDALAVPQSDPEREKKLEAAKQEYKKRLSQLIKTSPVTVSFSLHQR